MSDHGASAGVVISGVAATASLGISAQAMWSAMLAGQCGMGPMPDVESRLPPGSVGGQAADLPADYAPSLPREARYLRWTVEHALADAGLGAGHGLPAPRVSAVLGTTLHGIRAGGRFLRSGDISHLRTFSSSATVHAALRGLDIGGGVTTTCSACSSSLGAIALGVTLLESRQADLVVAGGYDAISEYAWAGFNALRLIAPGPLRPFCRGREGMKIAEGYGIVILEWAHAAARRGGAIRAHVSGWGESADAHHLTQPHPQGEGALAAMRQALGRAGATPRDLGMVAAHATGTPDNDASEFQALSRLLGDDLPRVPVVGFKSFLGHTLGGAGAVELVMSCMAMRDGLVPACPNVGAGEVEFAGLCVASGTTPPRDIGCTLNTSLGFGGANTCVVLGRHGATALAPEARHAASSCPEAWITGVGIVLPGAVGHAAFVKRARQPGPTPSLESLDDGAIAEWLNVRRARRLSQYVKLTLAAATMAVRDAGLPDHPANLADANAILGSAHGSACYCFEYYSQIIAQGAMAANPVLFAEGVPNAAAAHVSIGLGVRGACQTIIGSRTAGLDALAMAALRVRSGAAQTVIVVAAEEPCDVVSRAYSSFGLRAINPGGAPAPDGFTASCGSVALVVESSGAAAARGATPFARVIGSAAAQPTRLSGPAGAVTAALLELSRTAPLTGEVIGSSCGTWVDRAERLGLRRAGLPANSLSVHARFGEAFSVTPLTGIALQLALAAKGTRFTSLCTDWSGAATAARFEVLDRRLEVPAAFRPEPEP